MKLHNPINIIITLLLAISFPASANNPMLPFHAEYQLFHGDTNLGSGYYKLEELAEGHYKMGYQSAGKWLFLSDVRTETSYFSYKDGQIHGIKYHMERAGTGPSFEANVEFIASEKKVIAQYKDRKAEHVWHADLLDPLSYHQQLRLDVESGKQTMDYQVAYKSDLRDYHYKVLKVELLKLELGEFQAVKVERVRGPDSKKVTWLWLIPELNYVLGRVSHYEDGDLKVNMVLDELH